MAKPKKPIPASPKRVRPRPNAVMVDMDDEFRAMLEAIVDDRAMEKKGEPVNLASTIRHLISAEFKRRNLKIKSK